MKNLISLFFVLSFTNVFAQNDLKEDVRPIPLSKTEYKMGPEKEMVFVDTDLEKSIKKAPLNVKSDILEGFSEGNATLVASYFPTNIDISILGKSNLYSKSQAQQVLNTFFTQNKPSEFLIIHEGKSNGTKYFIGSYTSGDSKYRVTINVKSDGKLEKISSISIER